MRRAQFSIAIVCWLAALSANAQEPAQSPSGFQFRAVNEQSLALVENGRPVLVYNHGDIKPLGTVGAERACYVHPVYGLDGEVLTADFAKDHDYHRGMYWAWPHIQIGDKEYELWALRGELKQKFVRWLAKVGDANTARLAVENGWFVGERQLVREQVTLNVLPTGADSRAIDVELSWTPLEQPVTLCGAEGKSYGGFNVRFGPGTKPVITVPEKSELPDGVTAPAGRAFGDLLATRLPWVDFSDNSAKTGAASGAAIFVHPQHPDYPPTWMARHYGLVSVGWPGVKPQTIGAGETVTLRYRVWIHRGTPPAKTIQAAYDEYCRAAK